MSFKNGFHDRNKSIKKQKKDKHELLSIFAYQIKAIHMQST